MTGALQSKAMDNLRDNLVDLILKANAAVQSVLEEAGSLEYTYKDLCSIEADYMITNGVTVQKWIPVTERLPGFEIERVLFMIKGDFILGYPKIDTDRYVNQVWVRYGDNVTHWMPLPESPKEE